MEEDPSPEDAKVGKSLDWERGGVKKRREGVLT